MSTDTIVNCWRKSGLIDCKETREEVENLIEKEKSKYTTELEEELKLIGREAFFKQFIHRIRIIGESRRLSFRNKSKLFEAKKNQ